MLLFIIIITAVVSVAGFSNEQIFNRLKFNAYRIYHNKQWYRLFSHALLHANWMHLIINMLVLYSFGGVLFYEFEFAFTDKNPNILFLIFYILSIGLASILNVFKRKNDSYYNAVGASGAVSAVLFATILFEPYHYVYFFGIIPLPGIVFGVLYLIYSYYMIKKGNDNIGHDVHFWGAIFGFVFPVLLKPELFVRFLRIL